MLLAGTWTADPAEAHKRYLLQANWSRPFREYLYPKLGKKTGIDILEVGCGTGAVLECVRNELAEAAGSVYGLDQDRRALRFADRGKPFRLIEGNAEKLPFPNGSFDFVFCHYLLLWVKDPEKVLREMKRVTAKGGICAAIAEPCYDEMKAEPDRIRGLAEQQRRALAVKGADTGIGCRLGELFRAAGFQRTEWGRYQRYDMTPSEIREEIRQMEADTGCGPAVWDPAGQIKYEVPSYFAFGIKKES